MFSGVRRALLCGNVRDYSLLGRSLVSCTDHLHLLKRSWF